MFVLYIHPIKQGLKLAKLASLIGLRESVLYIHPIKQGLKLTREIFPKIFFCGSLHTSNKTRIETITRIMSKTHSTEFFTYIQ